MSQPVITISRQRGSGADDIAALVAHKLGIPLYDQQVISRAAREAGVSEETIEKAARSQGFLARLMENLGRYAGMGVEGAVPVDFSSVQMMYTSADYRAIIEEVLRKIAASGPGVIVGHGGAQVALRNRPDVLHVFLHAPLEYRIRRMMAWHHLDYEAAKRDCEESDRERTNFFRTNYNVNWYDLRLYDLVINTAGRTWESVAEEICRVAREKFAIPAADVSDTGEQHG
jgi:cytidylate kinase